MFQLEFHACQNKHCEMNFKIAPNCIITNKFISEGSHLRANMKIFLIVYFISFLFNLTFFLSNTCDDIQCEPCNGNRTSNRIIKFLQKENKLQSLQNLVWIKANLKTRDSLIMLLYGFLVELDLV